MLIQGDCIEVLKTLDENSVDAIVTDPPYELGFMGKSWDSTGIANNVDMWKECLRVLKPGGHLLSFGGTRTYHRMASAIEDAGFEIRDMIEWVYGSGFPKSLNIGKAVDKLQGNEREETDYIAPDGKKRWGGNSFSVGEEPDGRGINKATKGTSEWEGWGTALKPSHETICVAQKQLDTSSDIDYTVSICQTLFAQIVKKSSELNLSEKTQQGIVQWSAEKNINTLEDLLEVMAMLQLESVESLNLNIVLSWLNILGEIWKVLNISTIRMAISLTTELKILKSMEWENIFQNITLVKNNQTSGLSVDVLNVENLLNAVVLKLNYTLTHSVQDDVISQVNKLNFAPNHEPICMARKPLAEKTVAENVLKWGTGGINIDGCRVGITQEDIDMLEAKSSKNPTGVKSAFGGGIASKPHPQGRFPANFLHDGSEEVRECFPESKSVASKRGGNVSSGEGRYEWNNGDKEDFNKDSAYECGFNDSGNASRFFKSIIYQAKASKGERNMGLENMEAKQTWASQDKRESNSFDVFESDGRPKTLNQNNHPTVKPIALMEYLINMVTREGQIVLDPFAGSGSTLIAAKKLGRKYIGIELEPEYVKIAEERLRGTTPSMFNKPSTSSIGKEER